MTFIYNYLFKTEFNDLITASKNTIETLSSSETVSQIIKSKNLFNSFQFSRKDIKELNIKHLEFGSSSLYLQEMREAAEALLKGTELNKKEKQVLRGWLKATQTAHQILWTFDAYRSRIPFMTRYLLAGQDPATSWVVQALYRLYLPSQFDQEEISTKIIETIKNLPLGGFMTIPHGYLSHETNLVIAKDLSGSLKLYWIDPNCSPAELELEEPTRLLSFSFWKSLLSAKFDPFPKEIAELTNTKCTKILSDSHLLDSQKSSQCFAHCQWGFFRFYVLNHFDSHLKALSLEDKMKRKILEKTDCKDQNIKNFIQTELEFRKVEKRLETDPSYCRRILDTLVQVLANDPTREIYTAHGGTCSAKWELDTLKNYDPSNVSEYEAKEIFQTARTIFAQFKMEKSEDFAIIAQAAEMDQKRQQILLKKAYETLETLENNPTMRKRQDFSDIENHLNLIIHSLNFEEFTAFVLRLNKIATEGVSYELKSCILRTKKFKSDPRWASFLKSQNLS